MIEWASLGTVAGASLVASLVVQTAGTFVELTRRAKRQLSLVSGFVVVVGMTVMSNLDASTKEMVPLIVLSSIVGMQAGLAASKSVEILKDGFDHSTEEVT